MKTIALMMTACGMMCTTGLFADDTRVNCSCKNCACTPESHCGCYSGDGCQCAKGDEECSGGCCESPHK